MTESSVPNAVVDTNVFVSGAIYPQRRPRQVLRAWEDGRFVLILTREQQAELIRVLGRPKLIQLFGITLDELTDLTTRIATAPTVDSAPRIPVSVRDPKDEPILGAAIGGHADFLVTGDNDLLVLEGDLRLGPLRIVTPAQFLAALE